jgi:hypothetical protein
MKMLMIALIFAVSWLVEGTSPFVWAATNPYFYQPQFSSCDPVSEVLKVSELDPSLQFCSQWNPDFIQNKYQCCSALGRSGRKRKFAACSQERVLHGFCPEMTQEQRDYMEGVSSGKISDVLSFLVDQMGHRHEQAYCTVNNGFLVNGRPIVPSRQNRLLIQSPDRCTFFGTDPMTGMLEWVGREVAHRFSDETYSRGHILVGDVAGPRGGCLFGSSGRRRHASHTTGQDADIGFLSFHAGQVSPVHFHREFDVEKNWWFLKKILKNPIACVKVVFLSREHISKIARRYGKDDPDWPALHRYIRHMPGHSNHFHVRVASGSSSIGCKLDAHPELELEEELDFLDANEQTIQGELEKLKSRQSTSIE